jgi:hypothetical protein
MCSARNEVNIGALVDYLHKSVPTIDAKAAELGLPPRRR